MNKDLRLIKTLFTAILIIIALAVAGFVWYISANPRIINNNNVQQIVGKAGPSAYEIAVKYGFEGTEQQWIESLQGKNGKDGTTTVVTRNTETRVEVAAPPAKDGESGKSAYQIWIELGNTGAEEDFIRSLSPTVVDKVTEVRYNALLGQYETRVSGDSFWKVVPQCGVVRICK